MIGLAKGLAVCAIAAMVAGCSGDGGKTENGGNSAAPGNADGVAAVLKFREGAGEETVKGLARQGAGASAALVYVLTSDDTVGAMAAAEELARMGPDAIPALTAVLRSRAPRGRGWAAWSLGEMGPAALDARPDLERAAQEPELRTSANEALHKIGNQEKR